MSVIIPAHNEEKVIRTTLESLLGGSYPKFEVVVVDDGSTDQTAAITRRFIRNYRRRKPRRLNARKISIKLVRQENAGKAAALNNAIRNHTSGSLIMCLDADSTLHRDAITNTVSYFRDRQVAAVAANVRIIDELSVLGLLQKFEHMIGYNSKKFHTIANAEYIIGGVASTYRRSVIKRVGYYGTDTMTEDIGLSMKVAALGNKKHRLIYACDVMATTEGVQTLRQLLRQRYRWKMGSLQNVLRHRHLIFNPDKKYSRMLTMYRMPMAVLGELLLAMQPLLLIYAGYLTYIYGSPRFFVGAYIVTTLYILWHIWPDENTNIRHKLTLSLYAPTLYFIFYIMDFVQTVAVLRCLAQPKMILGNGNHATTWVSPDRRGEPIVAAS